MLSVLRCFHWPCLALLVVSVPSLFAQSMIEWEQNIGVGEGAMVLPAALESDSGSNAYLLSRSRGVFGQPQTTILSKFGPEGAFGLGIQRFGGVSGRPARSHARH